MSFVSLSVLQAVVLLLLTAALIVFLYWLKPPPQRVVVPSTLIWARVLRERRRRSDLWRWLVSLLLALTAGLAIASAIGKPEVDAVGSGSRRLAFVLDNAPSMGAMTSSGVTRWESAVGRARSLISSGSVSGEYLVADTAGRAVASGFTTRSRALEQLEELELSLGGDVRFPDLEALRSAAGARSAGGDVSGSGTGADTRTVFLTDGVMVREVPPDVGVVSLFEPADNVGITAFDLRPVPAEPTRYEAFLEVVNHGSEAKRVAVQIEGTGGVVVSRTFSLPPGAIVGESLALDGFVSGPVRALVDAAGDALAADDAAYAYLASPRLVRVHLVTEGNPYLEALLEIDPRVELSTSRPGAFEPSESAEVYVFDRFAPDEPPGAPVLVFRPRSVSWLPGAVGEDIHQVSLAGSASEHPILRHVSLEDVVVDEALRLGAGEHHVVAGTELEPIIALQELPSRFIAVSFALADSNFPLQSSFPIFLSNAIAWLAGVEVAPEPLGTITAGVPNALVTDLEGRELATRFLGAGTAFTPAAPGIFYVRGAERELVVTANFTNPAASAINDSAIGEADSRLVDRLPGSGGLGELWIGLLLFALGLLLFEWWTYHRRLTV